MRLIDATKIEQFILNNCSDTEEINTIYGELINAPTIEERKEGEWINTADPKYSDNITCSVCGEQAIARFNFCPNCGARMKGE